MLVFSMMRARGAPQVRPSGLSPDSMRMASASLRGVDQLACPGARRAMNAANLLASMPCPEGRPSMTQPTAWECDCPNTVTRSAVPMEEGMSNLLAIMQSYLATKCRKVIEEGRVGLCDTLGTAYFGSCLCVCGDDGSHHRNAMVICRVDDAA